MNPTPTGGGRRQRRSGYEPTVDVRPNDFKRVVQSLTGMPPNRGLDDISRRINAVGTPNYERGSPLPILFYSPSAEDTQGIIKKETPVGDHLEKKGLKIAGVLSFSAPANPYKTRYNNDMPGILRYNHNMTRYNINMAPIFFPYPYMMGYDINMLPEFYPYPFFCGQAPSRSSSFYFHNTY